MCASRLGGLDLVADDVDDDGDNAEGEVGHIVEGVKDGEESDDDHGPGVLVLTCLHTEDLYTARKMGIQNSHQLDGSVGIQLC